MDERKLKTMSNILFILGLLSIACLLVYDDEKALARRRIECRDKGGIYFPYEQACLKVEHIPLSK